MRRTFKRRLMRAFVASILIGPGFTILLILIGAGGKIIFLTGSIALGVIIGLIAMFGPHINFVHTS